MKKFIPLTIFLLFFTYSCSLTTPPLKTSFKLPKPIKGTTNTLINRDWWKQFKDKTLNNLINTAIQRNDNMLIALEKINQLKAEYGMSKANMFPSIQLSGSVDRTKMSKKLYPYSQITNDYTLEGTLNFNPDVFGQLNNTRKSELYKLLAQKDYAEGVKVDIINSVAKTYFDLCATKDIVRLYRKIIKNDDLIYNLTKKQYKIGTATISDINKALLSLLSDKNTANSFTKRLKYDKANLEYLIGNQPKQIFNSNINMCNLPTPISIPPFIPSTIIKKRPDIKMALNQLKAADFNLKAAKALLLPSFNLTVEGGYESNKFKEWMTPGTELWDVFLDALAPILEFGRISNQIKEANSLRKQALLNYVKTVKNAFKEIYIDLNNISIIRNQIKDLKDSVRSSCLIYKNIYKEYKNGINNIINVLNSQNVCLESKINLLLSESSYLQKEADLYKDLGGGW